MTTLEEDFITRMRDELFAIPEDVRSAQTKDQIRDSIMDISIKVHLEVAKRYIEKALHANILHREIELCGTVSFQQLKEEWLIENGVETPKTESKTNIIGSNGITNPPFNTDEL